MPIVSKRPVATATSSFVPTPSVEDTSTGSRYPDGTATSEPNEPMSASTSGRNVDRASGASRRTASSPASMETPAAA